MRTEGLFRFLPPMNLAKRLVTLRLPSHTAAWRRLGVRTSRRACLSARRAQDQARGGRRRLRRGSILHAVCAEAPRPV
jgi:hypothetical protein